MSEQTSPVSDGVSIEEVMSVVVYVDDFGAAIDFYTRILGLKPYGEPASNACFLHIGDNPNGLYLEGGYTREASTDRSSRVSFMLSVDSVIKLFDKLKAESVRCVHETPKQMSATAYWLQFYDPAGNIIEAVGGA